MSRVLFASASLALFVFFAAACAESDGLDVDGVAGEAYVSYTCSVVCNDETTPTTQVGACSQTPEQAAKDARENTAACAGVGITFATCTPGGDACLVPSPAW